jgi:hypothetical protein
MEGNHTITGKQVKLIPPVDWKQDPYNDRTWRFWLHSLVPLDILFQISLKNRNIDALKRARDIALDWIRQNPRDDKKISEFAWYDMAVGIRTAYLAYLLRAGICDNIFSEDEISLLLSSLEVHGKFLADEKFYRFGDNHGLYQDAGLYLLANHAPFIPQAGLWRQIASDRFLKTVKNTVNWEEGVHLEHSPGYHFTITNLIRKLRKETGIGDNRLDDLVERMEDSGGWLVYPDGTIPQLGDGNLDMAPDWGLKSASDKAGMKVFLESGYAVVKAEDSYLIVAAGYHSRAHKHSDELTFCLFEKNIRIIVDSGRYAYAPTEPGRKYAQSAKAHNVLLVDGMDFEFKNAKPYGSGILATGEEGGWFAIKGVNPLLEKIGVRHHRFFIYRPGEIIVVVDQVHSNNEHTYSRIFHLGPDLKLVSSKSSFLFQKDDFKVNIKAHEESELTTRIVRGRKTPDLQGWTFPKSRQWQEVYTLECDVFSDNGLFVTSIQLSDTAPEVVEGSLSPEGIEITLKGTTGNSKLRISQRDKKLVVETD